MESCVAGDRSVRMREKQVTHTAARRRVRGPRGLTYFLFRKVVDDTDLAPASSAFRER